LYWNQKPTKAGMLHTRQSILVASGVSVETNTAKIMV